MRVRNQTSLAAFAAALAALQPAAAPAHFQLIYTPDVALEAPAELPLRLIFGHPFSNGHTMDMGPPEAFFVVHRGERTDLLPAIQPIRWTGALNAAAAYQGNYRIKRNGDYIFVLQPAPYFEASEDKYIQQITKAYVNKGGIPTDWSDAVGLPTEIVPLNKPHHVYVGSTFSGIVLSEGLPVAGAEVEIEYIAAEPDLDANSTPQAASVRPPQEALVVITDANGKFTFGLPRAGFWGFAALEVGPGQEHNGKPLSQDAVIWVRAVELK